MQRAARCVNQASSLFVCSSTIYLTCWSSLTLSIFSGEDHGGDRKTLVVRGCFRKFSARVRHANIAKALRKRSGFNIEAQHLPLICPTGKSAPLLIFRSPAPLPKVY